MTTINHFLKRNIWKINIWMILKMAYIINMSVKLAAKGGEGDVNDSHTSVRVYGYQHCANLRCLYFLVATGIGQS